MEPAAPNTDLGALWNRTVTEYMERTGEDISRFRSQSINDVMRTAQSDEESFQRFRHKGDTTDKVRRALGNHLGGMKKCLIGITMVGNAAAAFPPAMPVTIVFAACGRLLGAFAGVKADYNKVEDFYTQSGRFFERLSMIEGKISDIAPLQAAVVRVFANQLEICGVVEKKMTKHGRLKAFVGALWSTEDPLFANAIGNMHATLNEFSEAVGLASFAAIRDTQQVVLRVDQKTDQVYEGVTRVDEKTGMIYESVSRVDEKTGMIYDSVARVDEKADELVDGMRMLQRTQTDGFSMIQTDLREIVSQSTATLMKAMMVDKSKGRPDDAQNDKRKQAAKGAAKGDVGDKKFKTLRSIKNFFDEKSEIFPSWGDALKENDAQKHGMSEAFVDHTGEWLTSDPAFQQWMEGTNRVLWVDGPEGIGKSLLTYASAKHLRSHGDGHSSVASFYFKEDFPVLQSAQNALACVALQTAEANPRYAEHVEARMQEEKEKSKDLSTWQQFFLLPFADSTHTAENGRLFLLFDGLDETHEEQKKLIIQFLTDLTKEKSRVHVMVTSRSEEPHPPSRLGCLSIDITKEKMLDDIKTVISDRLNKLPRLNKFSFPARRAILRRVAAKADGMLYVEHILRRFSYIGREGAVRKELDKIPDNLEALYKVMLEDCRRNRSTEQFDALKRLFAWLAFSKRPLSLAEAGELVKLTRIKGDFDIEDEIIGRSSRILELSRTRRSDEDSRVDLKDDDNGDGADDHDGELDEYRNASLTFQERSLRQYFKALSTDTHSKDDLRTPASAAHFTILTMCVEMLMDGAKAGRFGEDRQLTSYAVNYWHEHFNELDPELIAAEDLKTVLVALHRVVSNENNVANLFERLSMASNAYPEKAEGKSLPWYEKLSSWTEKGTSLPEGSLNSEIVAWMNEVKSNPKEVLVPLCKAHIRDWLTEYDGYYALEAYWFAEATLRLSGHFHEIKDDPEKQIIAVADEFGPSDRDYKALRSIGRRLWFAARDRDFEDGKEKFQSTAMDYIKKSLELNDNDFQKGATFLALEYIYSEREEHQNAVDVINSALESFSKVSTEDGAVSKKQMDDLIQTQWLHLWKAEYYTKMEKKDEALAIYDEARKAAGEDTIGSYSLNQIASMFDEKFDPDGGRLIETVKGWSEKERNEWLTGLLQYWYDSLSLERIYRAAKLSDQTTLVFDWLTAFGKTLSPRSLTSLNLKSALAAFYQKVLGDVEKAKQTMHSALGFQPNPESNEDYFVHERISTLRLDLSGIIFSQFRASVDPECKVAFLNEMKALPGMKSDDEFNESHIGMLVAEMLRIMGPARDYQTYMNGIFKTCIDGLEDSVSWNDGSSLRLLAKVLGSLDGLERDARIAISSQFSIMDKTIFENSQGGSEGSEGSSESGDSDNGDEKAEVTEATSTVTDQQSPEDSSKDNSNVTLPSNDAPESTSSPLVTTEQETASAPDKDTSGESIEGTNNDTEPHASSDAPTDPKPEEPEEPEEDIGDYPVFCDGNCGREIKTWSEPLYLCLICPNADLCEECHAKRMAWNEPGADTQAGITFCGVNHCYIKGPMKGWKGIKDGNIRIGEEEITVKEWLRVLKEERWPKAWERYWLRQGGLKNIDVE